jgi:transcriptional regulator with XRE-family HTH domain
MQKRQQLTEQYLQILQEIKSKLNRKEFCELHGISESKLSRILNDKVQPDFELLDYMAMSCNLEIKMVTL